MAAHRTAVWNWWSSKTGALRAAETRRRRSVRRLGIDDAEAVGRCMLLLLLVPAVLTGSATAATTVYRSVNEDGVVVFSDQPPASGAADVLQIPVSPPAADAGDRLESLRASNDRLERARHEREAARAGSSAPSIRYTAPVDVPVTTTAVVPGPQFLTWPYAFPRPVYRGPLRPPHQPARIPPGFRTIQPGNHQLMRPIVSSRD